MEEVKLTIFHITWNINSLNFDTNKNYLVGLQKLLVFIRNTPKMLKKKKKWLRITRGQKYIR